MADNHGVATADSGMDMEAHEATYDQFIALTQLAIAIVLSIVLLLVLWGLKGHPMLALFGFIVTACGGRPRRIDGSGLEDGGAGFRVARARLPGPLILIRRLAIALERNRLRMALC